LRKRIDVRKIIHLVYEPACGLLTRWRLIDMDLDMDLDMDPHNLDLGMDLIRVGPGMHLDMHMKMHLVMAPIFSRFIISIFLHSARPHTHTIPLEVIWLGKQMVLWPAPGLDEGCPILILLAASFGGDISISPLG
jgi:hypothetical protein